ncbi:MAG: PDZ domain-containing protein, partial [Chloroflexales bacterium]|nr:PDZ domain-containing protein [Chloroflexales bacterium]
GLPEDGGALAAVEEVAEDSEGLFRDFFARFIAGVEELDYAGALATVGLEPRWSRRGPQAWLGLSLKRQGERTLVATVRSDSPAALAGVYADDELLALDGWRVGEERLSARLAERSPGAVVRLALFRGDALVEVPVTLAEAPNDTLELAPLAERSEGQQRAYQAWLGI